MIAIDIPMPKNCIACRIGHYFECATYPNGVMKGEYVGRECRPDDCPLHEVNTLKAVIETFDYDLTGGKMMVVDFYRSHMAEAITKALNDSGCIQYKLTDDESGKKGTFIGEVHLVEM